MEHSGTGPRVRRPAGFDRGGGVPIGLRGMAAACMSKPHLTPEEFRRHGHDVIDWIADYWKPSGSARCWRR